MRTAEFYCVPCGTRRLFEQPPCGDEHGQHCAEWACVVCGHALLVGPLRLVPMAPSVRPVSPAPQRRAA